MGSQTAARRRASIRPTKPPLPARMLRNKRLNLSLLIAAVLAVVFWTQSRVPALNEKAQMGLRTQFNEIAFDTILPVAAEQGLIERVLRSTVNWAWTNWKGMTFGLLFAAAALLLLSAVQRRSFNNAWLNTLFGAAAGAPLGVCVNCATPIAQGIYAAGARLETALATLVASPTLNVIVLTMSFTLLPWEIATAKLAGVFAVLLLIPLLVRRFSNPEHARPAPPPLVNMSAVPDMQGTESWPAAARGVLHDYAKYLAYIVRLALPLMLLAGLLGAIVVEVVPFDFLAERQATAGMIVLAALVATVLPVPIAFDVIVVSALLAAGADVGLATAVLFALGIYSIYPALVIAKEISAGLSTAIAATVAAIAVSLALATQVFSAADVENERQIIAQGLADGARDAFGDAMAICESVPGALHERCFADQLDKFAPYMSERELCSNRPNGLEREDCTAAVRAHNTTATAVARRDVAECATTGNSDRQALCEFSVVLRLAVDVHDVEQCNALSRSEAVTECRTQFVSSSLLFNPDDSVCGSLSGPELADCRMNARVYRLAETLDFGGCRAFRTNEQREFCRYVIASTMIGRQNDPSGCAKLNTPALIERCRSQILAWQAERQLLPEHCAQVGNPTIREMCHLRVASLRIDGILSNATLAARHNAPPVPDDSEPSEYLEPAIAPPFAWTSLGNSDGLIIRSAQLESSSQNADRQFTSVDAGDLGIGNPWEFRATDFFEPFIVGKGVASGDFNNDYWPDLVFASDTGIVIYQNTGGSFAPAPAKLGALLEHNTFVVAFVDANNDGFEDIFASAYGGANFLLLNSGGSFSDAKLIELPGERQLTFAAGFADINGDGLPDIVHGNWTSGVERLFSPEHSANEILFSTDNGYQVVVPDEVIGESLSVLLSDIDVDGDTDLVIANDRIVPDMFYLNDGSGDLQLMNPDSGLVPVTSMFTMSLDAADINNDLLPDLFSTDMTFARSSYDDYCAVLGDTGDRKYCMEVLGAYSGFQNGSALVCGELEDPQLQRDCFTAFALRAAKDLKDASYCEQLEAASSEITLLCHHLASEVPPEESLDQSKFVRQVQRNTLLLGSPDGFTEEAEAFGVDSSFWSWNGKAADLDNDGWQDIYVGNGFHFGDNFYEIQENLLFRNIDGAHFEEKAADWGVNDALNTPSYTYTDFDRDGDLDIVATGVLAPPRIYLNQEDSGQSLLVKLTDRNGNSAAIGAVITIGYGGTQRLQQRRELRLSGGFMSFDEPVAHFGLAEHGHVDWLEVRWPDGQRSRIDGPVHASNIVTVERTENP